MGTSTRAARSAAPTPRRRAADPRAVRRALRAALALALAGVIGVGLLRLVGPPRVPAPGASGEAWLGRGGRVLLAWAHAPAGAGGTGDPSLSLLLGQVVAHGRDWGPLVAWAAGLALAVWLARRLPVPAGTGDRPGTYSRDDSRPLRAVDVPDDRGDGLGELAGGSPRAGGRRGAAAVARWATVGAGGRPRAVPLRGPRWGGGPPPAVRRGRGAPGAAGARRPRGRVDGLLGGMRRGRPPQPAGHPSPGRARGDRHRGAPARRPRAGRGGRAARPTAGRRSGSVGARADPGGCGGRGRRHAGGGLRGAGAGPGGRRLQAPPSTSSGPATRCGRSPPATTATGRSTPALSEASRGGRDSGRAGPELGSATPAPAATRLPVAVPRWHSPRRRAAVPDTATRRSVADQEARRHALGPPVPPARHRRCSPAGQHCGPSGRERPQVLPGSAGRSARATHAHEPPLRRGRRDPLAGVRTSPAQLPLEPLPSPPAARGARPSRTSWYPRLRQHACTAPVLPASVARQADRQPAPRRESKRGRAGTAAGPGPPPPCARISRWAGPRTRFRTLPRFPPPAVGASVQRPRSQE